jgi:hypothetical protein
MSSETRAGHTILNKSACLEDEGGGWLPVEIPTRANRRGMPQIVTTNRYVKHACSIHCPSPEM